MSLYINRQHFKIKIWVLGEPYITIYRHTCIMNYMMNSSSKNITKTFLVKMGSDVLHRLMIQVLIFVTHLVVLLTK